MADKMSIYLCILNRIVEVIVYGLLFSPKRRPAQHPSSTLEPRIFILTQLLQVSQIGHQLNVNKKYEHLSRIDQTRETGSGFRKVIMTK